MKTVSKRMSRVLVLGMCLAGAATMGSTQANAGFFDELFGGIAPRQPTYAPPPADPQAAPGDPGYARPAAPRKRTAAREAPMTRQKTTDLMHDKTLRVGDAVMMKDGMHVYNGPDAGKHTAKQFVPVGSARYVSPKERAALIAMDIGHSDPLRGATSGGDTLASGRSAAVGVPVSAGFRITDARGASVRYVGP